MGAAAKRAMPLAAVPLLACALFLSGGTHLGPLTWIGSAALLLAAAGVAVGAVPRLEAPAAGLLACLAGLVVWCGLTVIWSSRPDESWQFTNRTLAYLAFAVAGVAAATLLRRPVRALVDALAALLGAVLGWALLTKAVPALYPDYGRIARLRAPLGYWNELALLAVVALCLALALAADAGRRPATRAAGAVLLYAAALCVLLTYSRANVALAVLAAAAWLALDRRRVESLAAIAAAALPAIGVFGVALALPGITNDGTTHAQRAHDGWIFALVVVAVGIAIALLAARLAHVAPSMRLRERVDRATRIGLGLALVAVVVLAIVFAGRVWHEFRLANDVSQTRGRLASLGSGNRWGWWQQAWHAFVHHPGGGTGAGTFDLTNRLHRVDPFDVAHEPHNVPLQFLSETGVPGFLLFLGAVACGVLVVLRARRRTGEAAVTALGLALAAWTLHMLVDIDWSYVAVVGPLLFALGALAAAERPVPARAVRLVPALAVVALAGVGVYSLFAPWLAQVEIGRSNDAAGPDAAYAHARSARGWDPLSFEALQLMAASAPTDRRAAELYQEATRLEPLNPDAWYELGAFAFDRGDMQAAYKALDRSWGLDRRDGPLAQRCSILDVARRAVLRYGPICRG